MPEDHLARFVVEIVEQLDLAKLTTAYRGRGSDAYHPAMMVALLFYGYATGVFSSRKLERATYDSVAFRYVAANEHPDHDTIANFRKRFLKELSALFVEILGVAQQMGLLKLGKVSLDGTKIHANASKHSALSWEYACKIEAQLKAEVEQLMRLAEEADAAQIPDGMSVPEELQRREERLAAIAQAKAAIEARAAERYARERAAYEEKMAARKAKEESGGRKPGGKPPAAPQPGPLAKDQVNLTDAESRIMPASGGGFEQAYNAQAGVDVGTMLVVEQHVSQSPNDKQGVKPTLANLDAVTPVIGKAEALLADTGYFSADNVDQCHAHAVEPYIAAGHDAHYPALAERLSDPVPVEEDASPVERMKHRLRTPDGRAVYAKRKCTVEPTFGIIKSVLGFRQFLLRGLQAVEHEWTLVCIGWNLKRMHRLQTAV
ncbi:MAG: transposase [Deltaproteobacteria bacterium]|nr:transposase [Deltaproteobacteria bacterium]